MEDKLINCKNCKHYIERNFNGNIQCSCAKTTDSKPYPLILGLKDNCPLSLRNCYQEKCNKENSHGKDTNKRSY